VAIEFFLTLEKLQTGCSNAEARSSTNFSPKKNQTGCLDELYVYIFVYMRYMYLCVCI
jgi:hypothetical protein